MNFKTRENSPLQDKQHIFVYACSEDKELQEKIIDQILKTEDGFVYAVLYPEASDTFQVDLDAPEYSRLSLIIPLITKTFIGRIDETKIFQAAKEKGIPMLPIIESSDLIPAFNNRFENMHTLSLSLQNPEAELEKQLKRFLINHALMDEIIRDAFTRHLFLSYRKKDKDIVAKIMKAVHGTRWAKAAAFWFDDYLIPGTDFESGIFDAMKDADAVVLAVTPSIAELNDAGERNYVCSTEYPEAIKLNKPVIPLEAMAIDSSMDAQISSELPGLSERIRIDDPDALNEAFSRLGEEEPEADPYIRYLQAMAYLSGIRVEKDEQKALSKLRECVDLSVAEAALQLAYMHFYGIGCAADYLKAMEYKQKAFQIVENWETDEEKLDFMYRILINDGKDPEMQIGKTMEECDDYYRRFIDAIQAYEEKNSSECVNQIDIFLWKAECYLLLSNTEKRPSYEIEEKGLKYFEDMGTKANSYLGKYINAKNRDIHLFSVQYYRINAMENSIRAGVYMAKKNYSAAYSSSIGAVESQEKVLEKDQSYEARWQYVTYKQNSLGYLYEGIRNDYKMNREHNAGSGKLIKDGMNRVIDTYESLYKEKKELQLGLELVNAYRNMRITVVGWKEHEKCLTKARERLDQIALEYPNNRFVEKIYADIDREIKENRPGFIKRIFGR